MTLSITPAIIADHLTKQSAPHSPVMLNEVMHYIAPKKDEVYVDCTFGAGGYSKAILSVDGASVLAIDQDPNSIKYAETLQSEYKNRFQIVSDNFSNILSILNERKVDGLVLDLGVSSMQLDESERGFSFMRDGPLDMRMSCSGPSASDLINSATEKVLADIIFNYGDEKASRKIARFIIEERQKTPIDTTARFASIVRRAIGHRAGKIDPATKTFQAIRIWVNDELGALTHFLSQASDALKVGGRLVVVTFHSTEDRIVKKYLQENSQKRVATSKYAKNKNIQDGSAYQLLTKKVVEPTHAEVQLNPRARSAKLRAAIKVA